MFKGSWLALALAGGAATLSGCVVVPDQPVAGYGYGPPVVRVAPPPVVVVPPRRHRHGHRHWHRDWDRDGHRRW